jgi:hypothetical protein
VGAAVIDSPFAFLSAATNGEAFLFPTAALLAERQAVSLFFEKLFYLPPL